MKIKISWPTAIIISMIAFIVFILSFVLRATLLPEYNHHLVSEDYYNDELKYQQEIDNEKNALNLKENVKVEKSDLGLVITFPSEFDFNNISGKIVFKRMSNSKIDFELPINLDSNSILIKDKNLVEGRWDVKIEWTVDNTDYLFKKKIIY